MDEEEERSGNDEELAVHEPSEPVKSEAVEITKNTVEFASKNSASTKVSQHSKNAKVIEIKKFEVRDKVKEENEKKCETSSRSRSRCRNRSRDPRRCQKHFREMIGKHESRNDQLERRESDLRKRLEILECSVPAVTVWNIWRMSQGAPISSIQRVIEKQFKGPIEERKIFPSTPSQHYDCRVREVEAERKQAQRRAEEARALWAQKEVALADKKRKIEEARKAQEDRKKEVARLEAEAKEAREALEKAKGDEVGCTEGECGEIKCREIWLKKIGSATSIRSTDLECLSRLQELAETELDLKRQIEELERREYAYMKTLEEADVLWAKVKGDAESSIDSLHDQLEAKIIANQELAGRTCQLEDELERMRKQLSAAHSEIKKCKEAQGHEVASGREDDFAGTINRDITAGTDQIDKDVDTGDFIKSISKEVNVKPQQMDKDTPGANDLLHTSSKYVNAVPDQTDKSTISESDLIKVSNKKVTVRPNQADQLSGRDTSHVTSSDIAIQKDGDLSQQDGVTGLAAGRLRIRAPKDIASGRPNDYAKVADAGGTIDQEGIDNAQLLIEMYADDYGACAPDFICNDVVLSPIGMPIEEDVPCPPDIKCDEPPKTKETKFTEPIRPQPTPTAATSSKRPEVIPAISEPVEVKIEAGTSRVQEDGPAKDLTEESKPVKDEVKDEVNDEVTDEVLLNMEYLDVPVESTGSTDTSKAGLTDVPRGEVVLTRDGLKSSHDGTPRKKDVTSISKRDSDDTEIERDTVKRVDITEEGFSGETVAEPTARPVVDLPEVQEAVTSDGVIKNIKSQVESAAALLPIPETTTTPMTPVTTPEPEFPSDVVSETPFEEAVDTPVELEREDAGDGTTNVLDQDTDEVVPRDTIEIEKKAETGSAASLPETKFQKEVVKDAEPSTGEELITQDEGSGRPYNEIKEERLSQQADTIGEDKSSNAKLVVTTGSERALTPAEEIKSEIFESVEKSSTIEVEKKGEEAAAELERMEEAVPTEPEKSGPAKADDIEEKKIVEGGIDMEEDKEASEVAKIDKAPSLSREIEKVEASKVTVEVEPFEVKEEEPIVTADEAVPKIEVKEESEPTDLIDEIKERKPSLAKTKVVYGERKKIPTPTVSSPKGPCICKPRTCPLEASRSVKQSPDKPRHIYLTVQQRQPRISKICQFFGESTIRDRKDASPGSRVRKLRCRGSLRNQSTVTTSSVVTQTDSSCIRNRKARETERDKARVSSGLYPETPGSPTHNKGGNAIVTTTIFAPTCKFIPRGSSNGKDQVSCSSCGKSITQRTSVSVKMIPSVTNKISKSLCCECDARATEEESEMGSILVNEIEKMSKEPEDASYEKEVCCGCSINVQDKYESRAKRKRKPETKDYGCLVKIPRAKANAKIQKKDIDLEITRSRKSEKLRPNSSCGCNEKSADLDSL
ncbi:FK506-binding protein 5-like [Cephus cinctus]|uniref:FK506-binding protein 5-like n=1 Tax=Cephus cinctus TaxID=211228 RepID=A0AAJ7W450_CEPCN|nr:FK506-binding protein 5-like [Cephus cinctus]